jgi:hypothetical protein
VKFKTKAAFHFPINLFVSPAHEIKPIRTILPMSNSPTPTASTRLDETQILDQLSTPDDGVLKTLSGIRGDLLMLGAGGKIGLGLTLMARRAFEKLGKKNRVIAVSRFSSPAAKVDFESRGITTISTDKHDATRLGRGPMPGSCRNQSVIGRGARGRVARS